MYTMRARKTRREGPVRPTKGPPLEDLELFLAFMNAVGPGGDAALASPRDLDDWLVERGLGAADEEISAADLARARKVCAGLRALIAVGAGAPADADALRELVRLTLAATVHPRFNADGSTWLEPASGGLDGVVDRLFAIAARARFENHWPRLKICIATGCGRVFYDESRNLHARWCSRLYTTSSRRRSRDLKASPHRRYQRDRNSRTRPFSLLSESLPPPSPIRATAVFIELCSCGSISIE